MKNKKKSKVVLTIIILLFLLAGGYIVCDSIFNVDISNVTEVNEKKLAEIPLAWDMLENTDTLTVFSIMENSDAFYYKIKNRKSCAAVSQVNRDKFNITGPISSSRCYRLIRNSMKAFLNSSYDSIPDNLYEAPDMASHTLFGKINYQGSKKDLKNTFGMGLRRMFTKYELTLSCQDIDISKMAVYKTGEKLNSTWSYSATETYADSYCYYFVVKTKVKTLHAKGNISGLGVFAKEGRSKKIKFLIKCSTDDSFKKLSIDSIDIK